MANKLRSREEYEDLFHDIICKMLPKFKRPNVRPTYQHNQGKAVKNIIEDGKVIGVEGFTKDSNVIYISVDFDEGTYESFTYPDGSVDVTRKFVLKLNIYGNQSQEVALIIWSLMRQEQFMQMFNSLGIALESTDNIVQMHEIINGEIFDRRDVKFTFNENVSIPVPLLNKVGIIDDNNIIVGVEE